MFAFQSPCSTKPCDVRGTSIAFGQQQQQCDEMIIDQN